MTILVIEDNAVLAKNIGRCFAKRGLATCTVSSLAEARLASLANEVSAICLDLQLPDGHGLSFLDDLVHSGRRVPAVVVTGTGNEDDRRWASRLGVRDFLIKPFSLAALCTAIDAAIENAANTTQSAEAGSLDPVGVASVAANS